MILKNILFIVMALLGFSSFTQESCCLPGCERPNIASKSNFFCDLDSLNSFEMVHFLSDSTFTYTFMHDYYEIVLSSSGTYDKNGDTIVLNSVHGDRKMIATNMQMIFITEEQIKNFNSRNIFCNTMGEYLLLISNENKAQLKYRMNVSDTRLH